MRKLLIFACLSWISTLQAATITNADFSNGLTGWTQFGTVNSSTISNAGPTGNSCLQLMNATGAPNGERSDFFNVESQVNNQGYNFSLWILRASMGNWATARAGIEFYNSNGTQISYDFPFDNLQGSVGWTKFFKHYISLPAGTTKAKIVLRMDYGGYISRFSNITFNAVATIQDLLDIGGSVTVPSGTYDINSLYFNTPGTTLSGSNGVIFKITQNDHNGLIINAPNCKINSLTVDGYSQPSNAGTSAIQVTANGQGSTIDNIYIKNEGGNAIRLDGATNIRISNCIIENSLQNGILCQQECSNIIITNNIIKNSTLGGIYLWTTYNSIISSNVITDCGNANIFGADGICLKGETSCKENVTISNNIIVNKNRAQNLGNYGIHVTFYKNVNITSNNISNADAGIYFEALTSPRTVSSCRASGNIIRNTNTGIWLNASTSISDIDISNNKIGGTEAMSYGISATGPQSQLTLSNNKIQNTSSYGINLYGIQNSSISNTVFKDCVGNNQYAIGISVCSNVIVSNTVSNTANNTGYVMTIHDNTGVGNIRVIGLSNIGSGSITNWSNTNSWFKLLDYGDTKGSL